MMITVWIITLLSGHEAVLQLLWLVKAAVGISAVARPGLHGESQLRDACSSPSTSHTSTLKHAPELGKMSHWWSTALRQVWGHIQISFSLL